MTHQEWCHRLAVELAILAQYPGPETAEVAKETLEEYRAWQREQETASEVAS